MRIVLNKTWFSLLPTWPHLQLQAFDTAVTELDGLEGNEYKDATLIMQLPRDNLTLWQAEGGDQDEAAHVDEDGTAVEDMWWLVYMTKQMIVSVSSFCVLG